MYTGLRTSVFAIALANFFYHFYYHILKTRLRAGAWISAATAGVLNVLTLNPIFVVAARLRTAEPGSAQQTSALAELRQLLRVGGPAELWSGVVPSLWLVLVPTVQYAIYERLKGLLRRLRRPGTPSSLDFFAAGAVAKAAATVCTYPLQVAQTLQRAGRTVGSEATPARPAPRSLLSPPPREPARSNGGSQERAECDRGEHARDRAVRGIVATLRAVVAEHGLAGLYRGLGSKLTQTVLTSALMAAIYERLVTLALQLLRARARLRLRRAAAAT